MGRHRGVDRDAALRTRRQILLGLTRFIQEPDDHRGIPFSCPSFFWHDGNNLPLVHLCLLADRDAGPMPNEDLFGLISGQLDGDTALGPLGLKNNTLGAGANLTGVVPPGQPSSGQTEQDQGAHEDPSAVESGLFLRR